MKVIFCTPTREKPSLPFRDALEASLPLLEANGIDHGFTMEIGPYISANMATLARKALDKQPDALVFLDDDLSWTPESLLKLILCPEDVVGGTYRFKQPEEKYMGAIQTDENNLPIGVYGQKLKAKWLPSGFLKITANAVDKFMKAYPELSCGPAYHPTPDLFNHGAHKGIWYGQDYAFCRNYAEKCGPVWLLPNLDITHHWQRFIEIDGRPNEYRQEYVAFAGNFHEFLRRQPGGDLSGSPKPPSTVTPISGKADALRAALAG